MRWLVSFVLCLCLCHCRRDARATDLDGRQVDPFAGLRGPLVLAFVTRECPISNQYAPELRRLSADFRAHGVAFWLVYPSQLDTAIAIRKHLDQFDYGIEALRDPAHALVERARAHVTPEVALFRADGALVYSGRIDDRFVALGKARGTAQVHDLEDAVRGVLAGNPIEPAHVPAVGCTISD